METRYKYKDIEVDYEINDYSEVRKFMERNKALIVSEQVNCIRVMVESNCKEDVQYLHLSGCGNDIDFIISFEVFADKLRDAMKFYIGNEEYEMCAVVKELIAMVEKMEE